MSLEVYAALPLEDDRVLWNTTQTLIERCMTSTGFDYPRESYPDGGANLSQVTALYPDSALVAEYGYLWREHSLTAVPPIAPSATIDDVGFQTALTDCAFQAQKATGREHLDQVLDVFYSAASQMSVQVDLTDTVESVMKAWAGCMRDRGYQVTDPRSAEDLASGGGTLDLSEPSAVAVATADFACRQEVGLREAQLTARQQLVSDWLDANPSAIADRAAAIEAVIARCLTLVPAS